MTHGLMSWEMSVREVREMVGPIERRVYRVSPFDLEIARRRASPGTYLTTDHERICRTWPRSRMQQLHPTWRCPCCEKE